MKFISAFALIAVAQSVVIRQQNKSQDEVDDLLEKQDQKDAQVVADKEFNDANSKINQVGQISRQHSAAEDEDYMKTVFDSYAQAGKDKRGKATGVDILTKDKAFEAAQEILMKWNDLPQPNAKKYLDTKFDQTWKKIDVNGSGFIDTTEAFTFTRQLMGTFTSLTDGIEGAPTNDAVVSTEDEAATDLSLQALGL